jgi:rhodanese-related sulfurtransferase
MNATATPHEVDPLTLKRWLEEDKAVLIDVREPLEYSREHITGSRLVPLSSFDPADFAKDADKIAVCQCRSGSRSAKALQQVLATGFRDVYSLKGGIEAWKAAGLPVHIDRRAPLDVMRQVQITAGALVLLGIVLALLVSPWFMALSAVIGAGLMHAGISGSCGMAHVLAQLPWNRPPASVPTGKAVISR